MIYELALVAHSELGEEAIASLNSMVDAVVKEKNGEVLIADDWGVKTFAQVTSNGVTRGHYLFFIYKADTDCNTELERRFKINESVIKNIIVKAGIESEQEAILKAYKTPLSKQYAGSVTDSDEEGNELDKDRKRFAKRKTCWFTAKKIKADWKDPSTFSWLVNEFGKISPARISGISRKHQRFANQAIKRARQVGIISHLTNKIAE